MSEYNELRNALVGSIRASCEGKRVGIAFSGGMDSGFLAAIAGECAKSVRLYTCGTDDSFDVAAAKELAEILGLEWVHCRISDENIEDTVREFIEATGVSDPFTVSYDLQLFTVCRQAFSEDDGPRIILSGQGSDEYFNGCARSVTESEEEYIRVRQWGIDRMNKVSDPCERKIAAHFKQKLEYPYQAQTVVDEVEKIRDEFLRPSDLDDRKAILKQIVSDAGYPVLAHRVKKASQYGSGTTELIRKAARKKGVRFNRFISDIYESMGLRNANLLRDSVVDVRMDPILLYDAEKELEKLGMSHSEAVAKFYQKMVKDGNLDFLD